MKLKRTDIVIKPDYRRVMLQPFDPYQKDQASHTIARVMRLSETEVDNELQRIITEFNYRHKNLLQFFRTRFDQHQKYLSNGLKVSENRKLLIGAYFTMEYSVEAAALFNPSMVWHPDQTNLPDGTKRFILSLRATGEGHISSITFRSGVIDEKLNIQIDKPAGYIATPELVQNVSSHNQISNQSESDYEVSFSEDDDLSERIVFPYSKSEKRGIEDARFVQFTDENDSLIYYATYTAYDGYVIRPQLLETKDFRHFKISAFNGVEVQNKGMALFPRKINGKYVMLSRQDNENNFIMFSDDIHCWDTKYIFLKPAFDWEFVQLGNCGSPVETEAGWLVLTHGVGAVRKYSIGACLLDLNDPTKVIGRLKEPLISPNENEREGYVPNVVYTCGGLIYNKTLILPYAMSDYASSIAYIDLDDLLNELIT